MNHKYEKLQNWFTQLCIKPTGFLVSFVLIDLNLICTLPEGGRNCV